MDGVIDVPTACEDCIGRLALTETQSFQERWVEADEWTVNRRDLEKSAEEGCAICRIHLEAALDPERGELVRYLPGDSPVDPDKFVDIDHMWLAKDYLMTDLDDLTRLMISGRPYDIFTYPDDPAAVRLSSRRTNPPKTGVETWTKIQRWIEECTLGHGHGRDVLCGPFTGAELPPRVMLLSGNDVALHAKLVEPKAGSHARYAALSYCWGPPHWNVLTTTVDNYEQHCREIPFSDLAKTIRDAIHVTQQLGLQYLWVDALCIIQDSSPDKDLQISKMRAIFENAFVTIVAAAGENASCGFLDMPTQQSDIVFKLPYRHPEDVKSSPGTIYATAASPVRSMRDHAINLRGWTLEERLLSRRKIIYFEDRVAWECHGISLADQGEIENMTDDLRLPAQILLGADPNRVQTPLSAEQQEWAVHTEWLTNIEWYTMRELTRPADKLRAVGGIAQKYQAVLQAEYLAGLWRGYELAGLLWRRVVDDSEDDDLRCRPVNYRAPSWSWASIDGKVDYSWRDREEGSIEEARLGHAVSIATTVKPDILEAKVQLTSPARPFLAVVGGTLTLEGMVKRVQRHLRADANGDLGRTLSSRPPGSEIIDDDFLECWPDAKGELSAGDAELSLLALTGAAEDTAASEKYSKDITFVIRGIVFKDGCAGLVSRIGLFEMWDYDYGRLIRGFTRERLVMR